MIIHVTILPIIDILKNLESNEDPNGPKDVYDNIFSVEIFPHQDMFVKVIAKKRYWILQQPKRFMWEGNNLFWVWEDRTVRIVPHPTQQAHLMWHAHEELGHFGAKCTHVYYKGNIGGKDCPIIMEDIVANGIYNYAIFCD